MTAYGRLNLLGMLLLPAAAVLAAFILWGGRGDTLLAVFGINLVPMLIAGLISGLLLRGAARSGGAGAFIALWPTLVVAVVGAVWYLWRALVPAEVAPGAEHIAAPQYLLLAAIVLGIVSWIGCRVARAAAQR